MSLIQFFLYVSTIFSVLVSATPRNPYKDLGSKNKICPCFNQHSDMANVPQMLDPKNIGLERLVIYAYRTPNGIIYTYIPEKDKQLLFPDLQYEDNDSLDTDDANELLKTIFSNHNKMNTPSFTWKNSGISQKNEPRNYFTESLKNDEEIEIIQQIPRKILENGRFIWPDPVVNDSDYDSSVIEEDDVDVTNTHNIIKYIYDNKYPDPTKTEEDYLKIPVQQIQKNPRVIITSGTDRYMVPLKKDSQLQNLFEMNENKLNFSPDSPKHQVPYTEWLTKNIYYGKYDEPPVDYLHMQRKPVSNFDKWFMTQMKLMELGQSTNQPIDFQALHDYVLTALKFHGIVMSKKGELRDSKGHILNMANIHLRRLLISDSLGYDKVRANPDGTLMFPKKSSYYTEALLIFFSDANKIIGMIPLGKTIVYNSLDSRNSPLISVQGLPIQRKLSSAFTLVNSDATENEFGVRRPLNYLFNAHVEPSNDLYDSARYVSQHLSGDVISIEDTPSNTPMVETVDDMQSYLRLLGGRLNEMPSQDARTQSEANTNQTSTQKVDKIQMDTLLTDIFGTAKDVVPKPGVAVDEYPPDIRIIGGSSATGSGAPINNRGKRSAFTY